MKVLLDPYGRGVAVPRGYSRDAASGAGDNASTAMKSVVVDPDAYDWEGDRPLHRPSSQTIVYEMHVDHILFYEYFHGDNGAGLGASHQTGWTGLVAKLIQLFGTLDAKQLLESGKQAAFLRDAQAVPVRNR